MSEERERERETEAEKTLSMRAAITAGRTG